MEAYIDDMLVKSIDEQALLTDLREVFVILRATKLWLNPKKCVFGATSGIFLGYMVSEKGISANQEKVRDVLNTKAPESVKDVQRLNGRLIALSRFLSKSTSKALPFFRILKQKGRFDWTEECQEAFRNLKAYLADLPSFSMPVPGERLYLYLSVDPEVVSSVLVREELGVQRPVYYVSKVLHEAEVNYEDVEKMIFAIVVSARRLRPYFSSHTIEVMTSSPLKQIMLKPGMSGRIVKWAIKLGKYDIQYSPRTAIKEQALSDFLVEFTPRDSASQEGEEQRKAVVLPVGGLMWNLFVDGASGQSGSGAGLVLTDPEGNSFTYAIRLLFQRPTISPNTRLWWQV